MAPPAGSNAAPPGSPNAMHIAVEASRLLREQRGIGRYVRRMLLEMPRQRPDLRFTMFVKKRADIEPLRAQLIAAGADVTHRFSFDILGNLRTARADVAWYPWNYVRPVARNAAVVATVHDVAPMLQLDHRWWKVIKRFKQRRRYTGTVRHAALVMTISQFTAREVERLLPVDPAKLRVTLLAADDLTLTMPPGEDPDGASSTLERLGITGPFFLTVGAHDARKNLVTLYRAMQLLHERRVAVPLVQCGPSVEAGSQHADAPWIRGAGYVSDPELARLYRKATALVFPSRYEGYGLPVSEAQMTGGCVICADAGPLPEIAGDAALYFPWDEPAALAREMTRLLGDSELRRDLVARGRIQARQFSWERCARETLAVFDEAVDAHR